MDEFRFVTEVSTTRREFVIAAEASGLPSSEIRQLALLLPQPIQRAACFFDALTKLWRYKFGQPMDRLSSGQIAVGTHMYHRIDRLVEVLRCAHLRLTSSQLSQFLDRLSDPAKHGDVLIEMLPVLRLDLSIRADYEVSGYGGGNRTIDWLISPSEGPIILMEVKHRKRDMIEYFDRLSAKPEEAALMEPEHDTDFLFQSVESKFLPNLPTQVLQGVWINVSIRQEETELRASFGKLHPDRVHFAILGSWQKDVYLLARANVDRGKLLESLGLSESERFVFQRGHSPKH